jgi:iron complex outermembrane receptor protein
VIVPEAKLSGQILPSVLRSAAVVGLFLAASALMTAQSSVETHNLQTFSADDQTGSQPAGAPLEGNVADNKGGLIAKATIVVRNDATGRTHSTIADAAGHFSIPGLPIGSYTVVASAPGFATITRKGIQVASDHTDTLTLTLQIGATTSDITVEADATGSVAAALAPMDALLAETSARTEITTAMIQNFMSPVADFGEAVEMAPGTFTTSSDGVGLGQSKTYFRGFPDGDYDIDFDGIPFYDTNTPTHHSWAFFPTQFLGGIDFDRSPGTAATIGPAPFGGSIHLLSKDFQPLQNIRGEFSGGSFNTYLYDGEYDSGPFGPGNKFNIDVDVHHLQSDGYQTFNYQTYNGGAIKVLYQLAPTTTITGFSGVIWVDANTPNFSATRCQMYGPTAAYTCTGTLAPFAGSGISFLLTNNTDPVNYLDNQYNYYHVPTDFEYVGLHKVFAHGFLLDFKPYTYNYDNSEKYTNVTPITEATTINGSSTYAPLDLPIKPCDVAVVKKGVTAIPCGVDKYNSYRKYGETSELDQVSKYGILKAGFWYEWANTSRHQFPSDPLNHWADQPLGNFNEKFRTNSYQPFAEYQYHVTKHLDIDAGVKFSYFTIATQQFADDGKTIGGLGTNNPNTFVTNGGSYFSTLPAGDANYRIKNNWSAYVQVARGTIVPPSSVFDYAQGATPGSFVPVATLPKQQLNTTYQTGTVLKLKHTTFDADYYHIRFQNGYVCSVTNSQGDDESCTLQPSSVTEGVEGESNIYFGTGISLYLNATYGKAYYLGSLNAVATGANAATAPVLNVPTPSNQDVQQTPKDTETEGITYQHKAFDFGIFNKRIGTFYIDNTNNSEDYHNQYIVQPFSVTNLFFNYTIRTGGRFDQTKLRLSFNNLLNEHSVTGNTIAGNANIATLTQTVNGVTYTYTDPFATLGTTPYNGGDNITILPGRSIMGSVTFGFSPHRR